MVSARFRYDIGDRIAHDNADDRRQEGDPKRFTDDAQKRRIGDKSRKVFEREFNTNDVIALDRKSIEQDEDHRDDDHGSNPCDIWIRHDAKGVHFHPGVTSRSMR